MDRYWLKKVGEAWKEVTVKDYVNAELSLGLHPKPGCGPTATASFGGGLNIEGRKTSREITEENYGWDPDFLAVARNSVSIKV